MGLPSPLDKGRGKGKSDLGVKGRRGSSVMKARREAEAETKRGVEERGG